MVVYQINDKLCTHAFLWRHNFRTLILAPSVVSVHTQIFICVCTETTDGAKTKARKLWRQRNACVHRLSYIWYTTIKCRAPVPFTKNDRRMFILYPQYIYCILLHSDLQSTEGSSDIDEEEKLSHLTIIIIMLLIIIAIIVLVMLFGGGYLLWRIAVLARKMNNLKHQNMIEINL